MKTICVIPARGGSVRVPKKNIRNFHGKPIIAYSIETALRFEDPRFSEVVVSTDSGEIADIAAQYGATVFWRSQDDGTKGTQEVARDVLLKKRGYDYVCVIYPTAPMLSQIDLFDGYWALNSGHFNYAFGVGANPLHDAGQFYWSTVPALMLREPLVSKHSCIIPVENSIDINTEEDWLRAEQMYLALRGNNGD